MVNRSAGWLFQSSKEHKEVVTASARGSNGVSAGCTSVHSHSTAAAERGLCGSQQLPLEAARQAL